MTKAWTKFSLSEISLVDQGAMGDVAQPLLILGDGEAHIHKSALGDDRRGPARLKNIRLNELSLVDDPANPLARIVLFKRAADDDVKMTTDENGNTVVEKPKRNPTEKDTDFNEKLPSSFQGAIKSIRARDPKLSHTAAMSEARKQFPKLFDEFQTEGRERAMKSLAPPAPVAKSAAVVAFEKRIDEMQALEKCSRIEALKAAAREYPQELEAYRSALV